MNFLLAFIVLFLYHVSDGQLINGISDPCPVWTEWAIGASCVMPNTLGTQVLATCPTQFTTGRRRRQINGTNWWSSANRQVVPLAPPTPIPNVDDKRRPYGYGGSYGGYGGFGGQSSFWSSVAAPCGRCAIQFRCRTRAPAYACSPTSEVERAPCGQGTDFVPCQAPIQSCPGATGNFGSQAGYNTYQGSYGQFGGFGYFRGSNLTNNAQTPTTNDQWWSRKGIKRAVSQWTKVPLDTLTTGDSNSDRRRGFGNGSGGFGAQSTVASPPLNCQQTATGCVCCCAPFNPVNGQCV